MMLIRENITTDEYNLENMPKRNGRNRMMHPLGKYDILLGPIDLKSQLHIYKWILTHVLCHTYET